MNLIVFLMVAFLSYVLLGVTEVGRAMTGRLCYFLYSTRYLLTFKDLPSKYKGNNDGIVSEAGRKMLSGQKRKIRIVFIRHGQSVWNSLFNAFGLGWPLRVVKAVIFETLCFFLYPFDSTMIDSPLSAKGKREAEELFRFIKNTNDKVSLDCRESVIVCSNLRRAMETALIGLHSRVEKTKERIIVDSSLQEGSSNIDAQSFSTEKGKLAPMRLGSMKDSKELATYFNPYLNSGNKTIGVDVYQRMDQFVGHIFDGSSPACIKPPFLDASITDVTEIVVVGHSGYFRNFFRRFLPATSTHVAKSKKMQNCAAVSFMLEFDPNANTITVDEQSITAMFKGFK